MFSINITPVSVLFLVFGLTYLFALVYVAILERRRVLGEGEAKEHFFSLIVPAHNEAAVIRGCLESLLALDYPSDQTEILVVEDGSTDSTAGVVCSYLAHNPNRVTLLRIPTSEGVRGKASALNRGFAFLREASRFRNEPRWIIGVFDADGHPNPDMLKKASFQFQAATVGGVQASVRIRNRDASWLTRMQDIEFAGFSRVTQIIRMRIASSAALGGNGQFVRASALEAIGLNKEAGIFWNPKSLTEDLDLSTRLVLRNWDLHHLNTSCVWQEGVETVRTLMKQRTRWAWGSLQVFVEYVLTLKVLRTPNVQMRKRLDLLFNLSMFLISPLVLFTWILTGFALIGLVTILSSFPGAVMIVLSFAYLPIVGYGLATVDGYRKVRLPVDLIGFAIYTYHWVPCLYLGLWHLVARHGPVWWKTTRNSESQPG